MVERLLPSRTPLQAFLQALPFIVLSSPPLLPTTSPRDDPRASPPTTTPPSDPNFDPLPSPPWLYPRFISLPNPPPPPPPKIDLLFLNQSSSSKFPEYEMPSVTWGMIEGCKERLVSRIIISDYLKSIGVIPNKLEPLELPSSVNVMCKCVNFLLRLGLTVDDFNSYPLMLACSILDQIRR